MSEIKLSAGDGRSERGGGELLPRAPRRAPVSRHGAISRELTKYASYKSWAEKVRSAFAAEDGEGGEKNGADGQNGRR
ncbi:MAG: hypothetical protein ACT4UP_03860 [Gammaproteobacteria bacterium]